MNTHDAVVIGAGPAGSTAAIALARRGWRVALVEKAAFPRRKVCGEYISPGAWPVLRELGLDSALAARAGPPVRRVGLFALDTVLDVPMPAPHREAPWGRALGRETLDTLLLERAARSGAEVLQPWRVESLRDGAQGHEVRTSDGMRVRTLRAPVVVAAHGSWEHGLPTQPARAAPRAADLLGFKAHFTGARLPAGLMPLVLFPGGYGGLVESDAGRVSFSCCIRRDALARCRDEHPGLGAGDAVLAHAAACARGLREALEGARRAGPWLAAGPIRPGARARSRGGIFAVGNAAGEAHPLVAEGIGMAIQSAWLLAQRLGEGRVLDGGALAAIGRAYERDWRRHFAPRVRAASLFALATAHAAGTSAALVARAPALLAWGARWSGKSATVALP